MSPNGDERERIVYVNENDRTEVQRVFDEHLYIVTKRLSPTRVEVKRFRTHPFHFTVEFVVDLPHERLIHRDGYLAGEYVLWLPPDHKSTDEQFLKRPVRQYLSREELRVTPEELHEAIASGRAEMFEWENVKDDESNFGWVRTPVLLEYR
ncbi:MAG: hypothetical protein KDB18_05400 [Salinibacterium sp.]|nr:hypothetical protein [Salinibacterium sp.]